SSGRRRRRTRGSSVVHVDVAYDLTKDDLFAFQWRAARRRRKLLGPSDLALLAAALLVLVLLERGGRTRLGWLTVVSDLSGILVFVGTTAVLLSWMTRRSARRALRRLVDDERPEGGSLGAHRVTLTEKECIEVTAVGESRTSWAGVDRVEQDEQYIYIYTGPHAALVVPRRAF